MPHDYKKTVCTHTSVLCSTHAALARKEAAKNSSTDKHFEGISSLPSNYEDKPAQTMAFPKAGRRSAHLSLPPAAWGEEEQGQQGGTKALQRILANGCPPV